MACHTPPLKKVKKQGEMPLPSLGPIPSLMRWDRGWVMAFPLGVEYDRSSLNPFRFSEKIFASFIIRKHTNRRHNAYQAYQAIYIVTKPSSEV